MQNSFFSLHPYILIKKTKIQIKKLRIQKLKVQTFEFEKNGIKKFKIEKFEKNIEFRQKKICLPAFSASLLFSNNDSNRKR